MSQIEMDFCMVFFWLGTAVFGALALARMAAGKIHLFGPSPFSSRAEYLEAAAEMDLEEFIGRARVTPESVKQKPEAKPPTLFQVMADVERTLRENPVSLVDVTTTVDSSHFGGGEVQASITPLPARTEKDDGRDEKLTKKFPLDRWFRDPKGRLVQVSAIFDGEIECRFLEDGWFIYQPEDLRPASPQKGEWWGWKDALYSELACYQYSADMPEHEKYVGQGLVEPVNFGKGDKKRPDVATTNPEQEKSRGWFRWKVNGELVYRAADYASGWHYYNRADGSPYLIPSPDVEPAYPKMSEWWAKNPCTVEHLKVGCWHLAPVCWPYTVDSHDRASVDAQAAECGCLVPVNFGKGLEKKSGVA